MKKLIHLLPIFFRIMLVSIFAAGIIQAIGSKMGATDSIVSLVKECPKHYDGEGNEIPEYAVDLYVKADFVWLSIPEIDTIQKYFYFTTRHICPFIKCPMKEQIRFHGCGICEKGTKCYELDAIHWENPAWTYDQCWDQFIKNNK